MEIEAYRIDSERDIIKMGLFRNEILSGVMRIIPPDDIELFRKTLDKLSELRGNGHKSIDEIVKEQTSPRCPNCTG